MKLKLKIEIPGEEPDEIVAMGPWRQYIVIATRRHIMLMDHHEETEAQLRVLAQRFAGDGLL